MKIEKRKHLFTDGGNANSHRHDVYHFDKPEKK